LTCQVEDLAGTDLLARIRARLRSLVYKSANDNNAFKYTGRQIHKSTKCTPVIGLAVHHALGSIAYSVHTQIQSHTVPFIQA